MKRKYPAGQKRLFLCVLILMIFVAAAFIIIIHRHSKGDSLKHNDVLYTYELHYGAAGFSHAYDLEWFLESFQIQFNGGYFGNEQLIQLHPDASYTLWTNQEATELYAFLPTEDYTQFMVLRIGDAGYRDYPGIWAAYDYHFEPSSKLAGWRQEHVKYASQDPLDGVAGPQNPVPLEIIPR